MDDHWPTFQSDYLSRMCQAFRSRSKALRYQGDLVCEAGVEIDGFFSPKSKALRLGHRHYYPGGLTAERPDVSEGLHVHFEPRGLPPGPMIDLVIWEACVHFELARATRKNFLQTLVRLEGLVIQCEPRELVEAFKCTVEELSLLDDVSDPSPDHPILANIASRWRSLS